MPSSEEPRRKRGGSYAVGRERRGQIIELAKSHFAQSGYRGTSTATIARSVGITEAGLLHHFPNKTALLLEVLASAEQDSSRYAEALLGGTASFDEMRWTLVRLAEHNVQFPGLVELFVVMSAEATNQDHPAHGWFADRYQRLVDVTTLTLRQAVEQGLVRSDLDCAQVARETIAVQDGLQLQWVQSHLGFDLVAAVSSYVDRLATALGAQVTIHRQ